MADYSKEEIKKIEQKWQEKWEKEGVYKVSDTSDKPKYYVLDMFPYPSGAGLHVGHPLGYIASDIVARYKRIKGFNVLHPMGFDAFGLPAEQYAIQTGQHPEKTTKVNIETYKRQLKQIGFSYDWSREVQTCDPAYYKWTQWIFMQLFNAWYNKKSMDNGQWTIDGKTEPISTLISELEKNGNKNIDAVCDEDTRAITAEQWKNFSEKEKENFLQHYRIAYQSETMVNWCAALGTVLSNDEVKDGVSERGGYPVERIKMLQWSMRITAYAERLLKGLDTIDWPEPVKEMQRNWIGKSLGCQLKFQVSNSEEQVEVFTTRIDTIFGVTFLVLAPEHDLVAKITTDAQRTEVDKYIEVAKNRSERERMTEVKRVSGAFTGAYATNPYNGEQVPVWISDYVLAGYGTGAVMAVPGHDERDHRFAKHFNLPIRQVVDGPSVENEAFVSWDAKIINSGFMNGLTVDEAIAAGIKKAEELNVGKGKVNFRLRDAIFGRQRYWGEPFPVYYKDGLPHLVNVNDLPIKLPEINEYKPTTSGEPPLARAKNWNYQGSPYELTTMPGWAGSSWYWFRYMDPKNETEFASKEKVNYWKDVDLYMGGSEHATGHLLYSRFWCKALKDLGFVKAEEPFRKLINQGHIQGPSYLIKKLTFDVSPFTITNEESEMGSTNFIYTPDKDGLFTKFELLSEFGIQGSGYDIFVSADISDSYFSKGNYDNQRVIAFSSYVKYNLVGDLSGNNRAELPDLEKFGLWYKQYKNSEYSSSKAIFVCKDGFYFDGKYLPFNKNDKQTDTSKSKFLITVVPIEKLSKSKENAVNPDEIVNEYGADTLRLYEMFLGPLELSKPWNTQGIDGVYKFLRRFWNLLHDKNGNFAVSEEAGTKEELKVLHKTLKKVAHDIENFSFNTTVSEFMICSNELSSMKCNKRSILEPLCIALSPYAPHITEELWQLLGHTTSIQFEQFVVHNEAHLTETSHEYPISINGKVRAKMNFALDMPKEDIEKMVLASEAVLKWSEGKPPKKVIVVPGKIVNVVL